MQFVSSDTRRNFLKKTVIATAGSALGSSMSFAAAKAPGDTLNSGKILGCYVSINEILKEPKYLDALQKQFGINTIIVSSGIKMPDWLREMNPLQGKGWMGTRPLSNDDDSQLVAAIEEAHRRGMKFWLYYTGHHFGQLHRPVCSVTFDGVPFSDLPQIKYAISQGEKTVCFNKPVVAEWNLAAYTYGATAYAVDGIYVTHFRYSTPSFYTNMLGCACDDCRVLAAKMGYDFAAMEKASRNLLRNLKKVDRAKLALAAKLGYSLHDFLQVLSDDRAFLDWLYFRSDTVGAQLRRIHDSIHQATNNRAVFVTDTHSPSQSLYIGHNYSDLMNGASDGLMPLAWLDFQYISAVAAFAELFVNNVPGLDEETAITFMLKFFGWEHLPIQRKSIAAFNIGETPSAHSDVAFYDVFNREATLALMTHELEHLAMVNTKNVPAFPVIKGHQWTEKITRELMDRCMSMGHTGYVLQRTQLLIDKSKL